MSTDKQINGSRRFFMKVAIVAAYVAPAIASMPAHATFKNTGSQPTKKVWTKRKSFKRVYRYRRYAYRNYRSYRRVRSYRSYYGRRW